MDLQVKSSMMVCRNKRATKDSVSVRPRQVCTAIRQEPFLGQYSNRMHLLWLLGHGAGVSLEQWRHGAT